MGPPVESHNCGEAWRQRPELGGRRLTAILGREAVASVPPDHAALASGANSTARYLGAACGITLFAVIATNTGADITEGWTNAVLIAAGNTLLAAALIAAHTVLRTRQDSRRDPAPVT
ncbi:hypothetical protein [Dietzia sp. PP-33]|jgi:predicted MFS family arabinose efflux permease|uniref:hypothetical protein n=1 Tax=Dietzia sp. PP-33 TaxID=2957500 RepID=UPI0029A0A843|nr:hypothetical protein [Dietzia sp. PP-33]MDX2357725.1 hypothetical protein [Dietzia sp. PP-33]